MKTTYRTLLIIMLLSGMIASTVARAQATPLKPTILKIERRAGSYNRRYDSNYKSWNLALGITGIYSIPFGNLYNTLETGFGYEGHLNLAITPNLSFRLSHGRSGVGIIDPSNLKPGAPSFYKTTTPPPPSYLHYNSKLEELRIDRSFISLQITRSPRILSKNKSLVYIYAGVGQIAHHVKSRGTVFNDSTNISSSYTIDITEKNLAFTFGVGSIMMVSNHVGFDFQLSSDVIDYSEERYYNRPRHYPDYDGTLDFRFGLVAFY